MILIREEMDKSYDTLPQKEKRSRCLVIKSSIKREIRKFQAVDGSDDQEMYGTKARCTCKLVFWQSKPIVFFAVLVVVAVVFA